ncbi:MAG: phage tail tape measure protein, partial [Limosilactobacillus reuteri]|nr:phage tail tape measure protein [Limosilactobacillus reuteri]
QANKQLSSYESQASRAQNAVRYQTSGLAGLQHAYRQSQEASMAYVNRLNAEHRSASASVEKYRQLKTSLTNLESQYRKQEFLLKQIANDSGKTSDAYIKQREQLNKTATSIAKTKGEMKSMQSTIDRLQPTGINKIDTAVVRMGDTASRARSKMVSAFDSIRSHWQAVGVTALTVGGTMAVAVQKASSLQDSYRRTSNLLVTGGEKVSEVTRNVNEMQRQGQALSVKYGVSQQKIADAYQELTKRGYTSSQSLGAMKTMLQASAASGDDLNEVVTASTSAMEAFGLRANGTAKMLHNTKQAVNEMAYAADMTVTDFKSMSVAMEYAGPQAKTLGYNVGQTAAAIGVLSNNGLEADKAGTGMRQVLNSLIKPTKNADAALKSIGLSTKSFTDKSGKMKSMDDIFKLLNQHTSDLNKQQKGALFKALFGSTGESAGIILANNAKQLDELDGKVQKAGQNGKYVQDLANKNMNTAKANMNQLKMSSESVTVALGNALLPALTKTAQSLAKDLDSKQGQRDLDALAKGAGHVDDSLAGMISWMTKHTTTVKVFGGALVAAFGAAKLLDAIGRTRRRINDLRAVISKIPMRKHTNVTADTQRAQQNIKNVNRELDRIPKNKRSSITVDSRSAVANTKAVGTASKEVATTSKLSFASIGTAAKTAGTTISLAFRANPFGMIITGIQIAVSAFQLLYAHSKTFRKFVNGLASDAKKGMKAAGRWFSNTFKDIDKAHQQSVKQQQRQNKINQRDWNRYWRNVRRGWTNYWRQQNRQQQQNQRTQERQELASQRRRQRAIANFNRTVSRDAQNAWRGMERAAKNGSSRVGHWYDELNRTTSRSIQNMARNHPRLFNDMYRTIQDRTRVWHDVVTGHWSDLRDDTAKLAQDASRTNKNIFEDMYSVINRKTGGWLDRVVGSWKDHMSAIGDAIESARKKAGQAMADLANGVLKPFKTLIDDIQGGINWVLNKVGGNKLDGSWSAAIPTFATGTKGNPDGLKKATIGMVNDGPGSHWRELYSYKGHVGAFPNKRNFITYLPEGMSILNGEESHQVMKMMGIPHFANGVGDFFKAIKDGSDDLMEYVDDILKAPVEFMKDVFKKFVKVTTNIPFAQKLVTSVPEYIAKQLGNWVKKQFATLDNPGGAGVERWRPYIIRAFKELGVAPAEWKVAKLLRQIQTESGGDPHAFQHGYVDANTGGNEARGLLQFAGSTWRADALPGHTDWRNGYNEILAAIHVLEQGGEGGWGNVGNGHGWANGGVISAHGFYEVAEQNKPEMIIPLDPSRRGRAYQLLSEVMAQFKHEDGPAQPTRDDQSISQKEFMSLESKLDQLISGVQQLVQVGQQQIDATINSGNKFGMKANRSAAYTVMARDQRLNDFMSYRR